MLRAAFTASASVALALLLVGPSACVIPTISQGSDDAGSTSSSSSGEDAGSTSSTTTAQGASCTQITSSISLCEYINLCPNLALNTKVFPECGFRIHGTAIDLECLCENEYLCPIGVNTTTCAEATAAAGGDTTYDSVCEQIATGGCTDLAAGGGSTGSSTTNSACQQCISACDNVPSCIDACGC